MNAPTKQPDRFKTVKRDVTALINTYFAAQISQATAMSPSYERLWRQTQSYLLGGGKRSRPYLVVLSYQAYGGTDYDTILHVASAWELVHNCLLIHDDIIDRDITRHGKPNIAGAYRQIYGPITGNDSSTHYADSAALVAGDLLMNASFDFIVSSNLSSDQKVLACKLLNQAIFHVCGGEFLDMEAPLLAYGLVESAVIAQQKTAHYSFISPLQVGASLAGASDQDVAELTSWGAKLGIGYQLVDDMLGLYGDEAVIGKSATSDLREAKHTAILDQVIKLGNPKQVSALMAIIKSGSVSDIDVATVRALAEETGAKNAVQSAIDGIRVKTEKLAQSFDVGSNFKKEFLWVVGTCLDRTS
jgi:geranylgeranyl diphosphate synthase type II